MFLKILENYRIFIFHGQIIFLLFVLYLQWNSAHSSEASSNKLGVLFIWKRFIPNRPVDWHWALFLNESKKYFSFFTFGRFFQSKNSSQICLKSENVRILGFLFFVQEENLIANFREILKFCIYNTHFFDLFFSVYVSIALSALQIILFQTLQLS